MAEDSRAEDPMDVHEGFCSLCYEVYNNHGNINVNCVGTSCLFPTYFAIKNDFHIMLVHYGYSLLQNVIEHRHATDSSSLKLWIKTKLIDIKAMKNIEDLIPGPGPDSDQNQGPDPGPDENQGPVHDRGHFEGGGNSARSSSSSAGDDSHDNNESGGSHGDIGNVSTALVPYCPLTHSLPLGPPPLDIMPLQAFFMKENLVLDQSLARGHGRGRGRGRCRGRGRGRYGGVGGSASDEWHANFEFGGSSSEVPLSKQPSEPQPAHVSMNENLVLDQSLARGPGRGRGPGRSRGHGRYGGVGGSASDEWHANFELGSSSSEVPLSRQPSEPQPAHVSMNENLVSDQNPDQRLARGRDGGVEGSDSDEWHANDELPQLAIVVVNENLNEPDYPYNTRYKGNFHPPPDSPESPRKKKRKRVPVCDNPRCNCRRANCACYLARLARGE